MAEFAAVFEVESVNTTKDGSKIAEGRVWVRGRENRANDFRLYLSKDDDVAPGKTYAMVFGVDRLEYPKIRDAKEIPQKS